MTSFVPPGVSSFKSQFFRDFPYSASGVNAAAQATINTAGNVIAITPTDLGNGYTSVPNVAIVDASDGPGQGALATASIANSQVTGYTVAAQGAGYQNPLVIITGGGVDPTNLDYVTDQDITNALLAAGINFNAPLWGPQGTSAPNPNNPWQNSQYVYLLKAAHFLCLNIKASTQGLRGRGGEWLRAAFSVGDISANYQLPPRILNSNILAPYLETTYGCQYLQLLAPNIVANTFVAIGHTKP